MNHYREYALFVVETMVNRGKGVILGIFVLALVMGGFAWWHQYQKGRLCNQLWGSQSAVLIRYAGHVELLMLEEPAAEPAPTNDSLSIDGKTMAIEQRADITDVRGLGNARHALAQDASFDWKADRGDCQSRWRFAMRFIDEDGGQVTTVAFDPACNRVCLVGSDRQAVLAPWIMEAFAGRATRWLQEAAENQSRLIDRK